MEALKRQVGGTHYTSLAIQPAEYILGNDLGKYEGDIIQYVTRWKSKGGIEDLKKIQQCAQILIDFQNSQIPDDHNQAVQAAHQAQIQATKRKAEQDAERIQA